MPLHRWLRPNTPIYDFLCSMLDIKYTLGAYMYEWSAWAFADAKHKRGKSQKTIEYARNGIRVHNGKIDNGMLRQTDITQCITFMGNARAIYYSHPFSACSIQLYDCMTARHCCIARCIRAHNIAEVRSTYCRIHTLSFIGELESKVSIAIPTHRI